MSAPALYLVPAPALGPVQCATWCVNGQGHTDAEFAADQFCHNEPVSLTTQDLRDLSLGVEMDPGHDPFLCLTVTSGAVQADVTLHAADVDQVIAALQEFRALLLDPPMEAAR